MRRSRTLEGVELAWLERGAGSPLLVLHGFTGCAEAMDPVVEPLSRHWRVLAPDLLGHGESEAPRDIEPYSMQRCCAQLAALLDAAGARPAHVFGYSMGGRVALALAVQRPDCVRSLALLGASAGLAEPAERRARRRADAELAAVIERDGVASFARRWAELPLFASQQHTLSETQRAALQRQRLRNRARGLAGSLRGLGTGSQPPLHPSLGALDLPVWLGHGALDAKFAAIAADLASRIPEAERCALPAAGHAAHLENPAALARELVRFFSRAESLDRPADIPRAAHGGPA